MRHALALITASALLLSSGCGSPDRGPVIGTTASADSSHATINVYAATGPDGLSEVVRGFPDRIYVPNSGDNAVDVIDPHTFTIVDHFALGLQPQHVVPSYDLKTLWVANDLDDSLTRIDPATGRKLGTVKVEDPYNLYYTPDGRFAIVVAERLNRLDFRDAVSLKLAESVPVPCRGVDHLDFAHTGRYLIATCEFSGDLVKVDFLDRHQHAGSRRQVDDSRWWQP